MGYYTVKKSGSTHINAGTEEEPKLKTIEYEKNTPVDVKKGALDHVPGAKYHSGSPKDFKPKKDEKKP